MMERRGRRTIYLVERIENGEARFCEIAEKTPEIVKSTAVKLNQVDGNFNWDRYAIRFNELFFVEHGRLKVFDMQTGHLLELLTVPMNSIGGVTIFEEDVYLWSVDEIYKISFNPRNNKRELVTLGNTHLRGPLDMVRILYREDHRLEFVATFNTIYEPSFEGTWRIVFTPNSSMVSRTKIHEGRLVGIYNKLVYVRHALPPSQKSELISLRVEQFGTPVVVSRHPVVSSSWSVAVCEEGFVRLCYQSNSGKGYLEIVDMAKWTTLCKDTAGGDLCRWVDCAPVPVLLGPD